MPPERHLDECSRNAPRSSSHQHFLDGLLDECPGSRLLASMKRGLMSISDHSNNAPRRPFFDTVFHRVVHRATHGCPQGSRAPAHSFRSNTRPSLRPEQPFDHEADQLPHFTLAPQTYTPIARLSSTPHSLSSMPRCAVRRSEGLMTRARHRGTGHLLRPGARPGRCADEVTQPCTPALRIHPELDTHLPRTCSAPR